MFLDKPSTRHVVVLVLFVLLSGACNLPGASSPTADIEATFAAATVAAILSEEPTEIVSSPTHAPETEAPTSTFTPPAATDTPTVTPTEEDCDKVSFVTDVTIADGTAFQPGETFTKTWRLSNDGSCPWTTEYDLVFAEGDQMGGADETALSAVVEPGSTVDLSVDLTAPDVSGTYRGYWQLRNDSSVLFGIGEEGDKPFWVEIVVSEDADDDDLKLGTPTWRDDFEGAVLWFLLDTDESKFEVVDNELVMESFNAGGLDEWGLSVRPDADDFYIELRIRTGDTCAGLDRYGVLIRAEDPDHTYVYGFSCSGRYRLYEWDGGEFSALAGWKSSSLIKAGPNQTNRMGIMAEGNTIRLYANGKLITTVEDDTFDEGRFGLFIGSAETDNFKVYVEEVSYWDR
jgi:hypothetical protein